MEEFKGISDKLNLISMETELEISKHSRIPKKQKKMPSIQKPVLVISLSYFLVFCELFGWWISGSIAILVDSSRLIADILGVLVAIFLTQSLSKKEANEAYSFGFKRAYVLGNFFTVFFVWVLNILLCIWSVYRLFFQVSIDSKKTILVGFVALFENIILRSVRNASDSSQRSPNNPEETKPQSLLREISLCLGAMALGISLMIHNSIFLDSIFTFILSLYVGWTHLPLFKDSIYILMEGTPEMVLNQNLKGLFLKIPEVQDVHDFHCWSLSDNKNILSSHILTSNPAETLKKVTQVCREKGIKNSTIQLETTRDSKSPSFVNCAHNIHE